MEREGERRRHQFLRYKRQEKELVKQFHIKRVYTIYLQGRHCNHMVQRRKMAKKITPYVLCLHLENPQAKNGKPW